MNNVINVEEKNVELFNSNDECNFTVSEKKNCTPFPNGMQCTQIKDVNYILNKKL